MQSDLQAGNAVAQPARCDAARVSTLNVSDYEQHVGHLLARQRLEAFEINLLTLALRLHFLNTCAAYRTLDTQLGGDVARGGLHFAP